MPFTEMNNWGMLYRCSLIEVRGAPLIATMYQDCPTLMQLSLGTALHIASEQKRLILLIRLGADTSVKDANGHTAFEAEKWHQTEMKLLQDLDTS